MQLSSWVTCCPSNMKWKVSVLCVQTALEEAVADGDAAKKLLQMERDSTALLAKAREAAVQVPPGLTDMHLCAAYHLAGITMNT